MKNGYLERVLLKDFGLFSVCIFKRHPDKIYFLAAAVFSGGDFTPTLKAGFRGVTYCFRFWGCQVFHCKVNKASSAFQSHSTEVMLWVAQVVITYGKKKKTKLPITSHLLCTVSGCSGREHYVEKSAVKGRPPLKCINVRFLSTKQCLSMWSTAFDTQQCGACQPSLLPSLNTQKLILVSQILTRGCVHIKAL